MARYRRPPAARRALPGRGRARPRRPRRRADPGRTARARPRRITTGAAVRRDEAPDALCRSGREGAGAPAGPLRMGRPTRSGEQHAPASGRADRGTGHGDELRTDGAAPGAPARPGGADRAAARTPATRTPRRRAARASASPDRGWRWSGPNPSSLPVPTRGETSSTCGRSTSRPTSNSCSISDSTR